MNNWCRFVLDYQIINNTWIPWTTDHIDIVAIDQIMDTMDHRSYRYSCNKSDHGYQGPQIIQIQLQQIRSWIPGTKDHIDIVVIDQIFDTRDHRSYRYSCNRSYRSCNRSDAEWLQSSLLLLTLRILKIRLVLCIFSDILININKLMSFLQLDP